MDVCACALVVLDNDARPMLLGVIPDNEVRLELKGCAPMIPIKLDGETATSAVPAELVITGSLMGNAVRSGSLLNAVPIDENSLRIAIDDNAAP